MVETTGYNSCSQLGPSAITDRIISISRARSHERCCFSFLGSCLFVVGVARRLRGWRRPQAFGQMLRSSFVVGERSVVAHKGSLIVFLMLYGKLLTIFVLVRRA